MIKRVVILLSFLISFFLFCFSVFCIQTNAQEILRHEPDTLQCGVTQDFEISTENLDHSRSYSVCLYDNLDDFDPNTGLSYCYPVNTGLPQNFLGIHVIDQNGNVLCTTGGNSPINVPLGDYEVRLYITSTNNYVVSSSHAGVLDILAPVLPTPTAPVCGCGTNCCTCGIGASGLPCSRVVESCCAGVAYGYCSTASGACTCTCVTPTLPPPPRTCSCRVGDPDRCHVDTNNCQDYNAVCDQQQPGFCSDSGCTCEPYPTAPTTPYPTEFQQCDQWCTELPYVIGNCTNTGGNPNPNLCQPPPDPNGNFDCVINGVTSDCYCCTELLSTNILRPGLNPLCGNNAIETAIGCLPVGDKNAFLAFILRWAIGITSGVSFILIIYSGFTIMTSGGDKRKLQSGKELLTAALAGLMLIIFSVFILDFIGIRILRIPGL